MCACVCTSLIVVKSTTECFLKLIAFITNSFFLLYSHSKLLLWIINTYADTPKMCKIFPSWFHVFVALPVENIAVLEICYLSTIAVFACEIIILNINKIKFGHNFHRCRMLKWNSLNQTGQYSVQCSS